MPDNPVRTKLAALRDAFLTVRMGYGGGTQQLQVKEGPDGAVQATYNLTAAEEADLTMANTDAVDSNTAGIHDLTATVGGLGPKVDAQTDAVTANTDKLTATNQKLGEVVDQEKAAVAKLAEVATLLAQSVTAQKNASQSTGFHQAKFVNSNGGDVDLGGVAQADRYVYGLGPSSGASLLVSLVANLVGGMADIHLYHVDPKATAQEKAYPMVSNDKATHLGDPVSIGPNQPLAWLAFGLVLPAGRQLRAHCNAGNVRLNVRVA